MRRISLAAALTLALTGCPQDGPTQKAVPNPGATAGTVAGFVGAGHKARLKADMTAIAKAVTGYTAKNGAEPSSVQDLVDQGLIGAGQATDPWDNPYELVAGDSGLVVYSWGADGAEGGEGANQDWSSADWH